jgi:dsDNA-specific endonuclease/ATPase MutS2
MKNDEDSEVAELIKELEQLQVRITRVNERLKQLDRKGTQRKQTVTNKESNDLRVGDRVEVTNRYKGRFGTQGTIIKITSAQVLIQEADSDNTFRKYKANVRKIT